MKRVSGVLAALATCLTTAISLGQGVLIVSDSDTIVRLPRPIFHRRPAPPPPVSYAIKSVDVNGKIRNQTGSIQVSQTFVNTGSRTMQVSFVFPLPQDAAVDQLTFMVDGKEIAGQLLPASKARSIYEGHVRRNQDPALLEWVDWGMFKTSVFPVPPGAERKVTLRYSQLLKKSGRLTDFLFPLATAKYTSKPVEQLKVNLVIDSDRKIKNIYSPTHDVNVDRRGNKFAKVSFEAKNITPSTDFRLFFDTADTKLGASVVSYRPNQDEDGYFLLLASPDFEDKDKKPAPKTVVFVVDNSGSMSGAKIEQAKDAVKFVLNNLNKGDTFNVVAYDSAIQSFRPELQRYDNDTREAALGFVEGIYAGGSTNIDGALAASLAMLQDDDRPSYVLFLTDGKPTVGERNEIKIAKNASSANKVRARVISLGVGYDVNSRLIDRLTRENFGQSEYIRPDQDIEEHVSRVYGRISAPVLTHVKVRIDFDESASEGQSANRLYPTDQLDVFRGDQLVIVGRYRRPGNAKITVRGKVGKEKKNYDFPAKFVKSSNDQSHAFVEKLWAMRRVGEIIDDIDLNGKNQELVDELMALATKHGILTPYTSFLADETQRHRLAGRSSLETLGRNLAELESASGQAGFAQRDFKSRLRGTRNLSKASGDRLADASAATKPQSSSRGGSFGRDGGGGPGGGGFGLGGLGGGAARRPPPAAAKEEPVGKSGEANVKRIGASTLYRRQGNVWYADNVNEFDVEKNKDKIKEIKRFSKEYFQLVKKNTNSENSLLAQQGEKETLIIRLRGVVYRIK